MRAIRLSLIAPLLLLLSSLHALVVPGGLSLAQSKSKTWPVQTKGQEGLSEPQERSTLPVPASEFSKPVGKLERESPPLVRRGAGGWTIAGGWRMSEAPKVKDEGVAVSTPGYSTESWLRATVPGTVLSTLVDRGVYPDPDFGLNNLAIPEALNKQDYWYRTEFTPPASTSRRRFTLTLNGINYSAVVWLNGRRLGEVRGAFTRGEFDATSLIVAGRPNALAVRVSPPPHPGIPHEESLKAGPGPNGGAMCLDGPTFICTEGWDWIPGVRDRATGLWQDVTLRATGAVRVGDVQVVTRLPLPDTTRAGVSVSVPLVNDTNRAASGLLEVAFEGVTVRKRVTVAPGGTELKLTPAEFPQLNVKRPRLWWPNGYGRPELYHLRVSFNASGVESDVKTLRFGIREVSYELTLMDNAGRLRRVEYDPSAALGERVVNLTHEGMVESSEGWVASFMPGKESSTSIRALDDRRASPHLIIRVNGVRVACRGGNWGLDDSRKRVSRERMEPYFRLHREAGLTMIRNWCGQNTEEVFYELADEYGLLVWNDFWLSTQDWNLEPEDPALFLANARDVIRRFRNHPSIAVWCGRNEGVPPPRINEGLDELIRTLDGTRYYSPNSRDVNLQGSGPWHYGDAFKFFTTRGRGFSTELGLPSPPSADTIRAMLPESDHWPPDDAWAYHDWHSKSGGNINHFMNALTEELGAPTSLEDFERKAQLLTYASHRAMFEGFNAHLWEPNTGRLMWMSHPAWPSMEWQMYSSDYSTHGAYFGVKKACEPVHAQLDEPDADITVVNNTTRALFNLRLMTRVVDLAGTGISTGEDTVSIPSNSAVRVFRLDIPRQAKEGVVFVRLTLADDAGRVLSENFYWRAAQKSGYRKLDSLLEAPLACLAVMKKGAGAARVEVELTNYEQGVALAAQVVLRDAVTNARVLPAYASDNFVSLLPGEARRVTIEVPAPTRAMVVELKGWNVRHAFIPVTPAR
ncbi:MAG TPA: glycoside hydrolase family 2 TIM barrel-domain containing protein [Pyrinomonadaceae bacterium]|jgi:beta-galactosidase/beta-glucuronidase|nr:glycoside hydrolase family 2 TIM barrel-domain containing protein [Pyrinomonadaceae bacterium]